MGSKTRLETPHRGDFRQPIRVTNLTAAVDDEGVVTALSWDFSSKIAAAYLRATRAGGPLYRIARQT